MAHQSERFEPRIPTGETAWTPRRQLAVVALLAAAGWAGIAGLGLAAAKLVEWEAAYGVGRMVGLV